MDKKTYYIKLQELVDRVKELKLDIKKTDDNEKLEYLKLAIESIYVEMRILMEQHKNL